MSKVKVIFHVDEIMKWHLVLANVNNFIKDCQDPLSIEVLANSEAVRFYLKSTTTQEEEARFLKLSQQGVVFAACNNSLNGLGIKSEELLAFVQVVPSGVVELALKQHEAYAYIKP